MSKLELNVATFDLGVLMSKLELELNVDTFGHGGINGNISAPGRVRSGKVRLALSTLIPFIFVST